MAQDTLKGTGRLTGSAPTSALEVVQRKNLAAWVDLEPEHWQGKDPKDVYQPDRKNVGQQRVKRRALRLSSLAHCLSGDSTMTSEDSRRSTLWVASSTKLLRPNSGV